jgi:alcohol dehydrogenase (NADP+)
MPIFGLGTGKSDPGQVHRAVTEAIRLGCRQSIAPCFMATRWIRGHAIRDAIRDRRATREELWITCKLAGSSRGRDKVECGLEKSLQDLDLVYLDMYPIHWPILPEPSAADMERNAGRRVCGAAANHARLMAGGSRIAG